MMVALSTGCSLQYHRNWLLNSSSLSGRHKAACVSLSGPLGFGGVLKNEARNCWPWARPSRSSDEDSDSGIFAQGNTAIISACFVGLFTGITVVLFNAAVHEIRDFCWDGRGAAWLREEPIGVIWQRVILVPASGGLVVSFLNAFRATLEERNWTSSVLGPVLKAIAACVTLGTGNSLGPEGPSVEIGTSVAKGIGALLHKGAHNKLSLKAAGSAAGISSGFNAAVAGCFFAVESVLWPSPAESSLSLTNTTSMVILSAVIASVVSEIGLGSEPAFAVPAYDFRTPTELPLYLLLGIFCGLVSVALSSCTSFMLQIVENIQMISSVPKSVFPVLGGLLVGLVALAYPEILYWGFENVDILLESRPLVKGLSADLLLQLVAVKIVTTSLCRASGLVGGYYAPSLFIGAATGTAYGKIVGYIISHADPIFHLSILEVASPQAYGLVGMAATLAGVCQVPLTAVLLLFELTQDYRIVLPLLGAVGLSSWVTSGQTRKGVVKDRKVLKDAKVQMTQWQGTSSSNIGLSSFTYSSGEEPSQKESNLCRLESSLCLYESDDEENDFARNILVAQAMRTRYVTVLMSTLLMETISLMLAEKQSCAIIVDENNFLIGLLTLSDIQNYSKLPRAEGKCQEELVVAEVCSSNGNKCRVSCTVTPNTNLLSALTLMEKHGLSQLPVILRHAEDEGIHPVGILDRECINVACRALATREQLS
ncbi:chloride channel protein CLC-e isoform X2 [Lycium ferocissimum]|uniref:chloride channel protein CLC-e isoform X2 n=1 Tax=Lycium ferocissimum TaxID=112874 RepID=UPI0028165DA4|nr:chloride channel protein CLC-e isoform X2 [Lycium ferocissimum]